MTRRRPHRRAVAPVTTTEPDAGERNTGQGGAGRPDGDQPDTGKGGAAPAPVRREAPAVGAHRDAGPPDGTGPVPPPGGAALPDRAAEDSDRAWGEHGEDSNDDRLRRDVPPHWHGPV